MSEQETMTPENIAAQASSQYTLGDFTLSEPCSAVMQFTDEDGAYITIKPGGEVILREGLEISEAARCFWETLAEAFLPFKQSLLAAAPEVQQPIASIVPSHCSGSALALCPGVLHVNKDGSGYIAINEDVFVCEDDRCEGPDGPEGSVHWIARFDPGGMTAVRDFLCGIPLYNPELTRADELREQNERLRNALERIDQWCKAYPLAAFPEPDLDKARHLLEAGGMTLDAISASSMRHALEGVGAIASAALTTTEKLK